MSLNTKRKEKDTLRWLLKVFVRMLNKEESEKIVIFFYYFTKSITWKIYTHYNLLMTFILNL